MGHHMVVHKNVRYRPEDADDLGMLDKAVPAPEVEMPEPNRKRRRPSTRKSARHSALDKPADVADEPDDEPEDPDTGE